MANIKNKLIKSTESFLQGHIKYLICFIDLFYVFTS